MAVIRYRDATEMYSEVVTFCATEMQIPFCGFLCQVELVVGGKVAREGQTYS